MPSEKPVMPRREYPKDENFDRAREIEAALENTPDMDDEALASLATKMNMAQALGIFKLTAAEQVSLKVLSQKFIPDAPKRIEMNSTVKTETIIYGWLEKNNQLRGKALQNTMDMELEENLRTAALTEFSEMVMGEEEESNE